MPKKIIIIAGPNGAGKTTFARAFLPEEAQCSRFLNADLIAAELSPLAPEAAAIEAGRLMLREMAGCTLRGESFALETTLSGWAYLRHIAAWRRAGYHVSLFFLGLSTADLAMARVAERVQQGGHNIPESVIRRRFAAGVSLLERYRAAVDAWVWYDNSGVGPVRMGQGGSGLLPSMAAMERAAGMARRVAIATDTAIVVMRGVDRVRLGAGELR